jgi:SWI/SNF-related matrix-associated actin-dependent regulator of chromatin subfamily A3
MLTVKL